MSKHTPGPLRLFQVGDNLEFLCPATEDGESILTITHEGNTAFAVVLSDMNARRLADCAIDPQGRMSEDDAAAVADYDKALLQIDAAIQKATGGAA